MTKIEQAYVSQGYKLPEGMTWDQVATLRAKYNVRADLVPEGVGPGCMGWGVPIIAGKYLKKELAPQAR